MGDKLPPLQAEDPRTDEDNNKQIMNAYNAIDDPTKFTTRSFAVIWNEGHNVRLISRHDARCAISIPWDEIKALRIILGGTYPPANEGGK